MTAEAQENLDEFLEQLHEEIKVKPEKHETWNMIGAIYTSIGEHEKALLYLEKTVELAPEVADGWNNLGVVHSRIGNTSRAIDYIKKAIQIEYDSVEFLYNLGCCYEQQGKYEEAKRINYDILENDSKHIPALIALGHHYFRLHDFPKAKLYFLEVLELEPENAVAWANLAKVHIHQNNRMETMRCFHQAVKFKPKDYESWFSLGVGYKMLGEYVKALKCFQVMVNADVNDDRMDYEMARVIALMGNNDDLALDCLQDAVYAEPSNLERAEKHKEFDRLRHTKKYKSLARIVQKKQALFGRPVFVDGCNVAYHQNGKKPRVENIILMREKLKEIGFQQIFFIVSAALKHHIDDKNKFQELEHLAVLQVTPFKADDDYLLIKSAMDQDGVILSNDRFKERITDKKIAEYMKKNQVKFTFVGKDIQLIMGRDFYL